jgi:type IV pilus assembly protein PilW
MTIVQNTRTVFARQNQLTVLQDNERVAMTIIADVIQQAGYFPDPTANTAAVVTTPITGTYSGTAPGDTLSITYKTHSPAAGSGDGILNCSGLPNITGSDQLYVNKFSVSAGQLVCTMNGTDYQLVNGVQSMSVLFGVRKNAGASCANCVDTYLNADQVTAAGAWGNVLSAMVTLTFVNPLYSSATGEQPPTIAAQRVVALMNKLGVVL